MSLESRRGLGDEAVSSKHSANRWPGKEFSADRIASVKTWSRETVRCALRTMYNSTLQEGRVCSR